MDNPVMEQEIRYVENNLDETLQQNIAHQVNQVKDLLNNTNTSKYTETNNQSIPGYFSVRQSSDNDNEPILVFKVEVDKKAKKIPKELIDFYGKVEEANLIINSLQSTKRKLEKIYVDKLYNIAKTGLEGETPQTELAEVSLKKLKDEIMIERGSKIKRDYMTKLGVSALILIIFAILIGTFTPIKPIFINVWFGAMIGTWVSYGARKTTLSFKELAVMEKDMTTPLFRLIFVGLTTIIVLLLFTNNLMTLSVGTVTTGEATDGLKSLQSSIDMQILFGCLCGLIESPLAGKVAAKATDLINI